MKKILLLLTFLIPTLALAINITVPQATNWGDILRGNANGTYTPVATSTLGISGSGTVTSVGMTVPTGFSISGSPITTTGTLGLTFTSGYAIPLIASTTNWNSFYDTPSTRISDGLGLTWSTNTLNCDTASGSTFGCLSSANWTTFNNKQDTISLTTTGTSGAATFIGNTLNIPQYSGTTYTASFPITLTGTTFGFAGLSTSTNAVVGNIPYFSSANTFANVATTTLTGTGAISLSNPISVIGGTPSAISCATANTSTFGCLTSTDWNTFNGKESALTFNYPLTRSTNTISLAFGTTTSNLWAGTQSFTNTANFNTWTNNGSATTTNLAITALTGVLVGNGSTKPLSVAVSGTDIKTINGSSILGSGDLVVTASAGLGTTTPWTVGQLAMVSSNTAVTSVATTSVACSGSVSCTGFNVLGSSPITITGTSSSFPFTVNSWGNSTTTTLGFLNGFLSTASSTATDIKVTGTLNVPNNTAPTMGSAGQIALDTTSNDLIFATSTTGNIIIQSATSTLFGLNGTTTSITSGLVQKRPPFSRQTVVTDVGCAVTSGTSLQLYISDGTNNSNTITCTTTYTNYAFTSNNVFTAGTNVQVVWGTKTGDTGDIISSFNGYQISN